MRFDSAHHRSSQARRLLVTALVALAVLGVFTISGSHGDAALAGGPSTITIRQSPTAVQAAARSPQRARGANTMFVEGDSLTSLYGSHESWYAEVARHIGLTAVVDAQGGSGFIKSGDPDGARAHRFGVCDGTTFAQRLHGTVERQISRARVVVLEGGRNDFHTCNWRGEQVPVSSRELRAAVRSYFDAVAELRSDPGTVFVLTPWGSRLDSLNRRRIMPIIRSEAQAHGFWWVDTDGVLDPHRLGENTIDGIHPDQAGSRALARAMLRRSPIFRVAAGATSTA